MKRAHVKKDDMVVVIAGADKGKTGKVIKVIYGKDRVLVEGVNIRKKALRRTQQNPQGGIEEIECPIHISNVMLKDKYDSKRNSKSQQSAE